MDVLEGPYYIRTNRYLSLYGLWPYQSSLVKVRNQFLMNFAISTIFLPHCLEVYGLRHNFHNFVVIATNILYYLRFYNKNLFTFLKGNKIKRVLDGIRHDFQMHTDDELEVLHSHSKIASSFNKMYTICMFSVVSAYNLFPFTLHLMDTLMPLNETRLQGKPRFINYHVGELNDSIFFITIHGFLVDTLSMFVIIGIDALYMSLSYHACALFVIVAQRIRNAIDKDITHVSSTNENPKNQKNLFYRDFVETIIMHQYAIEFVETIEVAFSAINLITISCSVIPLAVVGFQVMLNKGNVTETITYIMYALAEIVHLIYYNWPGEKIKENSLLVCDACYNSNWYKKEYPMECKKMMNLMMIRSQKPSIMTAGKIHVLGLENFAAIIKVSMSYLTVLSSII